MTTQYTVNIDWPALHQAFTTLDGARTRSGIRIGYNDIYDALGGSYYASRYEQRGLVGAVDLLSALRTITEAAWEIIHQASKRETGDAVVRSAVAVMLAAKPAYDLLAESGLCEANAQTITRGHDGQYMHCTGLHWLAGCSRDRRVTVVQARAIADGAQYSAALSDRDEAHPLMW